VAFYESFVQGKQSLCIVMEMVEGFSLSELIKIQVEKKLNFAEEKV